MGIFRQRGYIFVLEQLYKADEKMNLNRPSVS